MYAIYETATGILKSTGTVLGNNLPDTLTVVELNQEDSDKLASGQGIWDAATLSVINNPSYAAPVEELTIPITALEQLDLDMQNPAIATVPDLKQSIGTFINQIKG